MNIEDRIKFYLGGFNKRKNFLEFNSELFENKNEYEIININKLLKEDNEYKKTKKNNIYMYYYNHLRNLLIKLKELHDIDYEGKTLYFIEGDANYNSVGIPYICKTRRRRQGNIILNMNYPRHWNLYNELLKNRDISFRRKNNKIIWRGSTTGQEYNRGNRFNLVKKYFDYYEKNPHVDIAFSKNAKINLEDKVGICQDKLNYKNYTRGALNMKKMLNYKFLISVEGNDVSSGLKWMLLSNSVVLMPKPKVNSWLMEIKLESWLHYIPLADDFSDVLIMYKWCLKNLRLCEIIAKKSTEYMMQFSNREKEKEIERKRESERERERESARKRERTHRRK